MTEDASTGARPSATSMNWGPTYCATTMTITAANGTPVNSAQVASSRPATPCRGRRDGGVPASTTMNTGRRMRSIAR